MEAPRRIVVCFHEPHLGGATRSVERILPLLGRRGWEFSFWVPRPSPLYDDLAGRGWDVDGAPRSIEYSVRAWRLPPGPARRLLAAPSYLRRFGAFLRARRPVLVHANSILTLAEALAARRQGLPTLLHVHEMLPNDPRGRLLRRVAWQQLDTIVAVSRPAAARLRWANRDPVIVYEGAPIPDEPAPIRPAPHPFRVGTVAVVSTRKGSDLFVDAAAQLARRNGTAAAALSFEMIGAPSDAIERDWAQSVLERARAVGIRHEPSADVLARLRTWDAFVLPSRSDPFPISVLEAMASGLPVIATRTDGIREQVIPGTGMLIDPDDPRALADAIAWVAAQGATVRSRLGAAARQRVAANFSLEHQAEAMDAVYRDVLDRAGARRAAA